MLEVNQVPKPRRRTVYRVITDRGERKAISRKDALLEKECLDKLGADFPGTFPKVLKVVRRRVERFVFSGVGAWAVIHEEEIR